MPQSARLGKLGPRATGQEAGKCWGGDPPPFTETFDIPASGQENFNILTLLSLLNCEWHNKRTG